MNANVQDLRKIYSAQGIKGFSSANRAAFNADIEAAEIAAYAEDAARAPKPVAPGAPKKKGICGICGNRKSYTGPGEKAPRSSDMCNPCFEEGGWENEHNDNDHEALLDSQQDEEGVTKDCWICHPELNKAQAAPKPGRSRAGMVIVAKGTELHKSETFRVAAEAAGWNVKMDRETYELEADAEGEGTRYYATATKGKDSISLAWDGRAYDYPASSAQLNGKGRKVRNLKEALRLL